MPRVGYVGCSLAEQPMSSGVIYRPSAPRRRRRHDDSPHFNRNRAGLGQVAKISFLSCIITVSAISSSDNNIELNDEKCTEPRVVTNKLFNFHRPRTNLHCEPTLITPRDVPQLGDGIRSTEASGIFFDSLDKDGDGAIEPEEMAAFLQNEIGGKQFDTQVEVDEEVGTIMERLDQNHNNGLEMSDMLNYWKQLETLLSPEEVSEWIVYSVQLPRSIGK